MINIIIILIVMGKVINRKQILINNISFLPVCGKLFEYLFTISIFSNSF